MFAHMYMVTTLTVFVKGTEDSSDDDECEDALIGDP
jgi:hypothetical protein